ncbi:MAG TPA: hypothetical protein VGK67_00245 [Myxococcales bacterium]|jgi:hypothetical protein
MAEKGIGSKILGTFFERREPSAEEAAEAELDTKGKSPQELMDELVKASNPTAAAPAATPAPVPSGPKVTVFPAMGSGAAMPSAPSQPAAAGDAGPGSAAEAPQVAPANVNFEALFRDAGMDVAELDRVKKAEDLLKNLPPETPISLQKSIVEASLKAFGIEIAKIVVASQNQKKAIDTYVKVNDSAGQKGILEAEAQIKSLTEKIAALKADIEKRTLGHAGLVAAAQLRKAQIQKILDFFEPPKPG